MHAWPGIEEAEEKHWSEDVRLRIARMRSKDKRGALAICGVFCVETPFVYVKDQKYFRGNDDDTHAQYEK